jgi:hypothetical protein
VSGGVTMICSRRFAQVAVVGFLAVCCLFFRPLPALGQGTVPNLTGSSNCNAPDFDAHVKFINGPGDYYSVVIDKRNISDHPCILDGPVYGPSLVPDAGKSLVTMCYDCSNDPHVPGILALNPGQVVRQTFRWKTTESAETGPCVQPQWIAGPILLVAPSLLKKVCSHIETSRFSLVTSQDAAALEVQAENSGQVATFQLTTTKGMYYPGQRFSLRLSLTHAGSTYVPSTKESCPTFYLRERSPDGATRIDEVQPLAFKPCGPGVLGHQPGDWQSGFELDSGANSKWEGFGEHAFQVSQLLGSPDDPQLHFALSNILRIQVPNSATIARKWGPRVKGIAADITLDKDIYKLGEDVPLHLAIANFDAEVPLYSWDPLWDPAMVVRLEVQDAAGRTLRVNERLPSWSVWTGHGFGPRPFAKGKIVPMERSLGTEGWLPNRPGTYTIVVTWAPCVGPNADSSNASPPAELKTYAVAYAASTIQVGNVDDAHSK